MSASRRTPRRPALFLLLALAAAVGAARPAAALECRDLSLLAGDFLQKHIRFHELTQELRDRTARTWVERLDPQRVLFLRSEADALEKELPDALIEARKGECGRLDAMQVDLVAREARLEKTVRQFVERPDYAVDPDARLAIDPDKRGFPETEADREALVHTLVHFQISNYLETGESLDEARKRLVHRYELRTRRATELSREDLYAGFLDSFAASLDPHSSYLSADQLEDFQIQMQLSLEGIGVALSEKDGYSVVEQIIPGGAADRLGVLQPNDRIIAVAEEGKPPVDIIDMALRDVVRLIRGHKGTSVNLTVLRDSDSVKRFQVDIVRDTIDLEQQAAKLRFETVKEGDRELKLAVLDLPSFYGDRDPTKRQGSRDVKKLLAEAREGGADGLLLDLSRNGGGLLDDAVTISGFFLNEGGIVAVREEGGRRRVLVDPNEGVEWNGPMVVLISRVSASASEILAGALQDYHRAVVVGDDHTFGKGTVQSVLSQRPGLGALKVTTGLFFRPGGASTQHTGVTSDVSMPSIFAGDAFGEKTQPYSLPPQSIDPFLSPRAGGDADGGTWKPVTPEAVKALSQRSAERVAHEKFFEELQKQLAERDAEGGVLRLGDLMARREEQTANASPVDPLSPETAELRVAAPDEDAKESPQLKEALQVLADWVMMNS